MCKNISCWELIIQKKFNEACIVADQEYNTSKSLFHLNNKIIALLNLKKYEEALKLSLEVIGLTNADYKSDADNISAGIAYWLLDRPNDAIEMWRSGLNAKYTDAAGGVEIPALMYYASVVNNDKALEKEAVKILKRKLKLKASVNFPGSIAGYLLGNIDEEELLLSYGPFSNLKDRVQSKSYFYIAVKSLKNGDKNKFYENLEKCVSFESYLEMEYFLAVGELDKRREA